MKPIAIGYLRADVSGTRQQWDETQIRSLAKRLGYDLAKIVVFTEATEHPAYRLCVCVARVGAEAVIVPGAEHFLGDRIPAEVVAAADVVTVTPEATYARWSTGELPGELDSDLGALDAELRRGGAGIMSEDTGPA
ncbi:hypothetical protein [Nocardia sp. AG03]|uniref:hypothetical protein n=1 Tax=Nocardia sp. AG03 TaxID=3025312 RepID=UPI00241829FA|nr:hypothetical protein [Nocardia sp. AG03]